MFRQFFNWRTVLAIAAILIVSGTIFYSQYLAQKIAAEEQQKVEQWLAASKAIKRPSAAVTSRENVGRQGLNIPRPPAALIDGMCTNCTSGCLPPTCCKARQ